MKIILANPRGFCAGVNMAIEVVNKVLELRGSPIWVYHEIVHNRHVVDRFRDRGVIFVNALEEVPHGSVVIFSAHGVSPQLREEAKQRNLMAIDATCPLVTKVHMEAIRYARKGYQVLLIGHRGHDEVVGTLGEAPEAITVIESPEEIPGLQIRDEKKLVYLMQTTLSLQDAERIIKALREVFPDIKSPPGDDICYATTNRQKAVQLIAPECDFVIIVGSANSSNSVRLQEIALSLGKPAVLVDDLSALDLAQFTGNETVLISAGASAPEDLVEGIILELHDRFNAELVQHDVFREEIAFDIPVSLKNLMRQQGVDPSGKRILTRSGSDENVLYGGRVKLTVSAKGS
ncbi:MAG TPA: 4-hydroxy-3-methylbut-2-enyl diphosphate reductase [Phycisphaeraceae bacterium]|nr:4-hydroxy-3-methylbut-2-enyl diphosphate reductase [Phycisphaeraceae bacterium]